MAASESVKVIVRSRPLNKREKDMKCKVILSMESSIGQCNIINPNDYQAPPKTFTFDGAYNIDSTTEQIYNEIVFPIVECVTEGYNGTVFAYGQTGCGKSFTMQGVSSPASQRGIIPRAFEHIFEAISTSEDTKFLVHASYLEIYNEDIRDLLGQDVKKRLELKEHNETGVYIPGLSTHPVHNVQECESIMEKGWKSRSVGATLMNADSSRSHSIFTVYVERMNTSSNANIRKGKLNLVDLAGSERQAKTGATGDRLKEATKINLSLSALGNVISALVDGKSKHIPYRDSKLTRLLQDSLGGNTKTLMVGCLSPADNNYDETLSTLRYANRAKNIKNKPKVNEDPKDALLREYQEEIERLRAMISTKPHETSGSSGGSPQPPPKSPDPEQLEKIKADYDQKMKDLITKFKQEQESNAKLKSQMDQLKESYELKAAEAKEKSKDPQEAIERLAALQDIMVGGEKADDPELKEKRAKRKRIAEKKITAISEALTKFDDDDQLLLKAYGDITEELRARTVLLKKAKKKITSLEREVSDLQSEFEQDRTDYLETIRRLEQQVKLFSQILEKTQPCIRRDCNYANLDRIKNDCVWDEDLQKWRLPDLMVTRTKLPPPVNLSNGHLSSSDHLPNPFSNGDRNSPHPLSAGDVRSDDHNDRENDSIGTSSSPGDKLLERLEKGMSQNLAANYFKPKRRETLLNLIQKKSDQDFTSTTNLNSISSMNGSSSQRLSASSDQNHHSPSSSTPKSPIVVSSPPPSGFTPSRHFTFSKPLGAANDRQKTATRHSSDDYSSVMRGDKVLANGGISGKIKSVPSTSNGHHLLSTAISSEDLFIKKPIKLQKLSLNNNNPNQPNQNNQLNKH